ncbi:MAG: apolipoprotein N-acyltransferase, partial [Phycisphaeraceae bacterium]|nr:apolipoprotein N-acyltransferase [Phycisphaeraceae bacterium]
YHEQIDALSRRLGVQLMVGAHAYQGFARVEIEGRTYEIGRDRTNAVYLYRPDTGQAPDRYDKIHRVPFGEYVPWVERVPMLHRWFIRWLTPYDHDYSLRPGREVVRFEAPGDQAARLVTPICFEDTVGRLVRRMVYGESGRKQADALINLSNDGWFAGSVEGPQHLQIAVVRCIENRVPMARAVNTGISGMVDSAGRVGPLVQRGHRYQRIAGHVTHSLELDSRSTLFGQVGDIPAWTMVLGTLLLAVGGFLRAPSGR